MEIVKLKAKAGWENGIYISAGGNKTFEFDGIMVDTKERIHFVVEGVRCEVDAWRTAELKFCGYLQAGYNSKEVKK